ncbi:MAG: four helix bundle protein [Patescibacteria group bacterium]
MSSPLAFQKSYDFYKELYITLRGIAKRDRFTWGERCESMALELIQSINNATYAPKTAQRNLLLQASETVDMLKIYLRLGHDLGIINQQKLIARQTELHIIGNLVGGWIKKT